MWVLHEVKTGVWSGNSSTHIAEEKLGDVLSCVEHEPAHASQDEVGKSQREKPRDASAKEFDPLAEN